MLPITPQFFFITIEEKYSYATRSSKNGNFNVKFRKTKRKLTSVSIMGVKLWTQLDTNLHNVKTINIFKHIIKTNETGVVNFSPGKLTRDSLMMLYTNADTLTNKMKELHSQKNTVWTSLWLQGLDQNTWWTQVYTNLEGEEHRGVAIFTSPKRLSHWSWRSNLILTTMKVFG